MKNHLDSTSHTDIIQHNFWVPCFFHEQPQTLVDQGICTTPDTSGQISLLFAVSCQNSQASLLETCTFASVQQGDAVTVWEGGANIWLGLCGH